MMRRSFAALLGVGAMIFVAHTAQATTIDQFNSVTTSSSPGPGVWYTDRKNPAGFGTVFFNGDNRLGLTLSHNDYQGAGSFYNTQGRDYNVPNGTLEAHVSMYLDSAWLSSPGRDAGFWATGVDNSNNVDSYPIMEIANGHVMGWNSQGAGGWIDYGAAPADQWATLGFSVDVPNDQIDYFFNGALVGDVGAGGTTMLSNVMLQGVNTDVDRTYYFDNLVTNTVVPNAVPVPPTLALFGSGLVGLALLRRRQQKKMAVA